MSCDTTIPTLKVSACHLCADEVFDGGEQKPQFAVSAILHPFHTIGCETCQPTPRSPIICITCGGFMSLHIIINPASGEWCCPLCRSTNPPFIPPSASVLDYDRYLREN